MFSVVFEAANSLDFLNLMNNIVNNIFKIFSSTKHFGNNIIFFESFEATATI